MKKGLMVCGQRYPMSSKYYKAKLKMKSKQKMPKVGEKVDKNLEIGVI